MTEPVPSAAAAPIPAPSPAPGKTLPAAAPDPQQRVDALRAELAEAEAALPPEPGTVRLQVMPPHASFKVGSVTVGKNPTAVPADKVPRLTRAAAAAGVTIKEA